MNLLVRAIITGFGLKLGSEVAKVISARVRKIAEDRENGDEDSEESTEGDESAEDDDMPTTIPPDSPLI